MANGFGIVELSGAVMRMSWCLLLVAFVAVSAVPAPQAPAVTVNPSACAQIAPATAALLAATPLATPRVPATLAMQCLQSVPNKPEPAKALIKSLKAFVQWQSTLAFLKDPPASYMLPATDIEGRLDELSTKAAAGQFASEYDFQLGIFLTIASAHDGHFAFRSDVFKAFGFRNNLASDIVSVSRDGKELPKLYNLAMLKNATNSTNVPAITKINGQDAATFISATNLQFNGFQDPDSQWNSQFQSYANPAAVLTVAASLAFQGESVALTYDNGQVKTEESFAIIRPGIDFNGVNTGDDFYNRFCNPNVTLNGAAANSTLSATPTATSTSSTSPTPASPTIVGYPFPIVRDSGANTTSGYFLNGTGYDNVAVLSVLGFSPAGDVGAVEYLTNFQDTLAKFLAQSKAAGKTKLVIDVSANGGGFVVAGFELFAQLFPTVQRFQADNLRLADSLVAMARIAGAIPNGFNGTSKAEQNALSVLQQSAVVSNLVPGGVFTPEGGLLATVEDILSPVALKGDLFTAYQQAPLNATDPQFNLTGVGTKANPPPSVFKPEDIVILTDGTCGSTCTLFSYLMILQLNVKTVVVGGRPITGPMQSIAGVEGAQVFPLDQISEAASAAIELAPADQKAALQTSELGIIAEGYALKRLTAITNPGAVNGKNAFGPMDSQTPLQFLYEAANCKFFYTKEMLTQPTLVWQRAVDATWTNPDNFCVEGSRVSMTNAQRVDPLFRLSLKNGTNNGLASQTGSANGVLKGSVFLAVLVAGLNILVAAL